MNTVGKILIGLLFTIACTFLGVSFAAAAMANDDNPKNRMIREVRIQASLKTDINRLRADIQREQEAGEPEGAIAARLDNFAQARENALESVATYESDLESKLAEVEALKSVISQTKTTILNFASDQRAFQEALGEMTRRSIALMTQYQDLVGQVESLRIEAERVRANYLSVYEDALAIEEQIAAAQAEHERLTDRIAAMTAINPRLPEMARGANPVVAEGIVTGSDGDMISFDRGSEDGVATGMRFSIFSSRGDFKATVVVTQVNATSSTARLTAETRNASIQPQSDRVRAANIIR